MPRILGYFLLLQGVVCAFAPSFMNNYGNLKGAPIWATATFGAISAVAGLGMVYFAILTDRLDRIEKNQAAILESLEDQRNGVSPAMRAAFSGR